MTFAEWEAERQRLVSKLEHTAQCARDEDDKDNKQSMYAVVDRLNEALTAHANKRPEEDSVQHARPLAQLGQRIMEQGDRKGWNAKFVLERAILNLHGEVTEVWDHVRAGHAPTEVWVDETGKPDGVPVELIDVIYRALHLLMYYGLDPDDLLERKFAFNEGRSWEDKIA